MTSNYINKIKTGLSGLEYNKWYSIKDRIDQKDFIKVLNQLSKDGATIDHNKEEQKFMINSLGSCIYWYLEKELPQGLERRHIEPGQRLTVTNKTGKNSAATVTVDIPEHFEIWRGEQCVCIY